MARIRTGGASKADEDTFGIVILSAPPADPNNPKAVGDNDTRMTDSRTPKGSAGGSLKGSYPNPGIADSGVTAGTFRLATVDVAADGRITGISEGATGAVADASPAQKGAVLLSEEATDPVNPAVLVQNSAHLAAHIDGLKIVRTTASALRVERGSAWIPALRRVVDVPNNIAVTNMTLTANTWHYLYLHADGGTPGIEYSTEAPVAPCPPPTRYAAARR